MRLWIGLLLPLAVASSTPAVTVDWVPIADPGNACDSQSQGCFGAVSYGYQISKYEVTNAQYAEFLNAKAGSDPLALYNTAMGSGFGGIARTGVSGSFSYGTIAGREDMPVNYVSFYDALRFANWLNNGQGSGSTESGSYTLLGDTPTPSNGNTVARNAGATIVLTSEDEWYKAAYYNPTSTGYFDYPAGFDAQTICSSPSGSPNHANCNLVHADLTAVGSYMASASPYGTFDQGGNVFEWNESILAGTNRGHLGGSFNGGPAFLAASFRFSGNPSGDGDRGVGFRVAMVPEPGTGLLVLAGLLGLAGWRRSGA